MTIQTNYNRFQQKGYAGQLSRPHSPYGLDQGVSGVDAATGQGVYFDAGTGAFILPVDAATRLLVTHIVAYDVGTVQSTTTTPAGANSDQEITFAAGQVLRLADQGHYFVIAGETVQYGDELVYSEADNAWVIAPAATASQLASPRKSVRVKAGGALGDIIEVQLSSGTRY